MEWLENSIGLRMALLSQPITDSNFEAIEDQIIAYVASTQTAQFGGGDFETPTCRDCYNCVDNDLLTTEEVTTEEVRQRKTSSASGNSSTSGNFSASSFDTNSNFATKSDPKAQRKKVHFATDSDSSLPDTDSAVDSISSSEFERLNRKCGKPEETGSLEAVKNVRETLV